MPSQQSSEPKMPEVVTRKLGVAVVGLGQLAIEEVLPAFAESKYAEVTALVSGHPDKARTLATVFGVPADAVYDYAGFERLADDPRVDAVYIILPNSMHAEYTTRALAAGKHVLCEKPMATTVAEAAQMIAAAQAARRTLMIAYRLQYEPHHRRAIDIIAKQELGALRQIAAYNCQDTRAPNIRLRAALGGGPLQDVGIYCINAGRYLTGEMPIEASAMVQHSQEARFAEVPEGVTFTLRFPSGVVLHASCSFATADTRSLRAIMTGGSIELTRAFAYRGLGLHVSREGAGETATPAIDAHDQFALELDHFARAVLDGTPVRTPGEEGLADLRVIAAIEASIRTGATVTIG